jgi:hypothetical protein
VAKEYQLIQKMALNRLERSKAILKYARSSEVGPWMRLSYRALTLSLRECMALGLYDETVALVSYRSFRALN